MAPAAPGSDRGLRLAHLSQGIAGGFPADHYGSIGAVVDAIATIKSLPADQRSLATCTEANATAQAKMAATTPPVIKEAVAAGKIEVISAVYDIASGRVAL